MEVPAKLSKSIDRAISYITHYIGEISLIVVPLIYIGYGRAVLHMPTNEPVFTQIAQVFNIHANAMNGFYDSARTQDGQYATGYANIGHLTTQADIDAGWHIVDLITRN